LRQRQEDIHLLFRKFAADFADKYRMPAIRLQQDAIEVLTAYNWPGNIRQLKNLVEQLSVIEQNRELNAVQLIPYIPAAPEQFPSVVGTQESRIDEREIMYKFLFDMKSDLNDLKKLVVELLNQQGEFNLSNDQLATVNRIYSDINVGEQRILPPVASKPVENVVNFPNTENETEEFEIHEEVQESLSLESREKELIQKALDKHRGRRKYAAEELGISERTLYRKIKEYAIPG
jgi:DNA-binding NtrC family response regulator